MTNTNNYEKVTEVITNNPVNELFISELKKAYSMESLHVNILSKLAQAASNKELHEMLEDHQDITEIQVSRLEEIFRLLDIKPEQKKNETMELLCQEADRVILEKENAERDSYMLNLAQKMEYLEIASYKNLCLYSQKIQNKDITELLQATLDEEEYIEKIFNKITESTLVHI